MSGWITKTQNDVEAIEALSSELLDEFRAFGAERFEPPVILPAAAFLERLGEELRRRTYIFNGPDGVEYCLRPDLTIPAAQVFLLRSMKTEGVKKLCYTGPVFRHDPAQPGTPGQSFQAGVECFGATNAVEADVEAILLTSASLRRLGVISAKLTIGDIGCFSALLAALNLPPRWAQRLRRHVWRPDHLHTLLKEMTGEAPSANEMINRIGALPPEAARAAVRDALMLGGVSMIGTRSIEEITERYIEKAADMSAPRLAPSSAALITNYLKISCTAGEAPATLSNLTREAGIDLSGAIESIAARIAKLKAAGLDVSSAVFATEFGRNMEYYTGMVWEYHVPELAPPIAGGGRYDDLLQALGAQKKVPAIGLSIFAERVLAARALGAGKP